jgi:hypothetical protein
MNDHQRHPGETAVVSRTGGGILHVFAAPAIPRSAAMADGPVFARVHALVLCDDVEEVYEEEEVFNLHGVRTRVCASSFPYIHPRLCVFIQVSGHEGIASGRLALVKEAGNLEVLQAPIDSFQLSGPLTLITRWYEVVDCEFPEPGVYWVQVVLNGKLVTERRFHVVTSPGDSNGQPA